MAHFLQSDAWETYQASLGEKTKSEKGEGWSFLGIEEMGPAHTKRLYAPYGPSFSNPQALEQALSRFEAAAKQSSCVFVRVEPVGDSPEAEEGAKEALERAGYHRVSHMQPEDTWRLNLTVGEEALMRGMDKSNRKRYRAMGRRGIEIRVTQDPKDVPALTELMSQVSERNEVELRDADYVQRQADCLMPLDAATLYLAVLHVQDDEGNPTGEEKVIAANLVFDGEGTRILIHNGSDSAYYRTGANVAMQVQIVLDAAEKGLTWADFYGMAPEGSGPDHPWAGFTKFKQSFGGEPRHYLGTWEKPVSKAKYAVYETARKILEHK
ncbi:MAG: peptidoglycan bridge formation glycyltransferase FemA/FemB family protein [Atopobiaceae bacterium]|nr:peptidoglycan bridge formation glycyltransferase FemA/FemB family protein [Atopobiaceae bacterium]